MGVAARFYEAFTVRDHYTMGLLYAEHATFSDPVFQLLNAKGTRLMWQMLLSRAEDDFGIEVDILEDGQSRARVNWVAQYTFSATGRPVKNHVTTEMQLVAGKIVRQEDKFSLWRWSSQALGREGLAAGLVTVRSQQDPRAGIGGVARLCAQGCARLSDERTGRDERNEYHHQRCRANRDCASGKEKRDHGRDVSGDGGCNWRCA